MELESVSGVGEKTAAALAELDDPERALREGDVATLAQAPGISEGRAARIARAAIRDEHDDPGGWAATSRAREIYREALGLLQDRTVTDYAEKRLETIYPSVVPERIAAVRERARAAMEREPDEAVLDALSAVEPLADPSDVRVRDRCLATTDAERYAEAQAAIPEVTVEVVDDARQLAELGRSYATVVALDESFAGLDVDGDVRVQPDALENPADVVPERPLAFFTRNRDRIRAAVAVHRVADLDAPYDLDALESALDRLAEDGGVRGDDELDRLTVAVDDLDAAVSTAESAANDHLREAIEERDVTIEGTDLLSLVERGAGVDSLLSRELADEYDAAVAKARDRLIETLGLTDTEAVARRAFPDDPTYPVEHNEEAVSRLREELTAARDQRATRLKRELADDLAEMRGAAETLVETALELDVELAIARFAADFDCTMPEVGGVGGTGDDPGFAIEGGRSPLLDVAFEAVEPVDYRVDGVALLSGVNSGGKTSTLDLVALVTTLAHMGLPVPAEHARIGRVRELHYHAKTQGTLDAGAFEATLRDFGALVEGVDGSPGDARAGRVMVLVDELESITEPGAAATIVAGILEALAERDATGVFVSHLAGDIIEAADAELSVDGIQAEGLVDGELRVNRSPVKGTLARSTPELIVEKLADDAEGDFYGDLLGKFE
ncbi:helix-hairpin-helix domain-containing protein [Halomicrobium sp. LC1Hm]|uniref:helix-hairpin-helix domain-containing protein n=1 Tax=Halomicrobium sp. LC1Hm TaxID=2610902 RepID=UPI001298397C|nr:helix-hairpin-helix domain-containing protein [Halomicrobium sp. LC1Hm]QGA81291.1 DNA structure-specific ATPase involved in suppression of recombination, MutS family [Halomicrobium sp. LC1Hm]